MVCCVCVCGDGERIIFSHISFFAFHSSLIFIWFELMWQFFGRFTFALSVEKYCLPHRFHWNEWMKSNNYSFPDCVWLSVTHTQARKIEVAEAESPTAETRSAFIVSCFMFYLSFTCLHSIENMVSFCSVCSIHCQRWWWAYTIFITIIIKYTHESTFCEEAKMNNNIIS